MPIKGYDTLDDYGKEDFKRLYGLRSHAKYLIKKGLVGAGIGGGSGAVAGNIVGRIKRKKAGEKAVQEASSGLKNKVLNVLDKNRLNRIKDAARKKVSLTKHTLASAGIGAGAGAGINMTLGHRKFQGAKKAFVELGNMRQDTDKQYNRAIDDFDKQSDEKTEKARKAIIKDIKDKYTPKLKELENLADSYKVGSPEQKEADAKYDALYDEYVNAKSQALKPINDAADHERQNWLNENISKYYDPYYKRRDELQKKYKKFYIG